MHTPNRPVTKSTESHPSSSNHRELIHIKKLSQKIFNRRRSLNPIEEKLFTTPRKQNVVIIGPVEELLFRFYIQDTIKDFLPNLKWISVIVSSILFGAFHVNFDLMSYIIKVCMISFLALFFGGVKYYFDKDFGYFGLALCHGLYDFLLYVIRLTIV